ncbi:MAG: hypothetical protein ABSG53_12655, partial [Thermoguttaceae bacterium]
MWMQLCCGLLTMATAAPALADRFPPPLTGPKHEPENRPSEKQLPESERGKRDPVGLRLTGRVEIYGKSHQFEIVMEDFDRYYRKEWAGEKEKGKAEGTGFWIVSLVLGDFGGAKSLSWGKFGSRGGGNYGENGKTEAEVARRLWTGDKF